MVAIFEVCCAYIFNTQELIHGKNMRISINKDVCLL